MFRFLVTCDFYLITGCGWLFRFVMVTVIGYGFLMFVVGYHLCGWLLWLVLVVGCGFWL